MKLANELSVHYSEEIGNSDNFDIFVDLFSKLVKFNFELADNVIRKLSNFFYSENNLILDRVTLLFVQFTKQLIQSESVSELLLDQLNFVLSSIKIVIEDSYSVRDQIFDLLSKILNWTLENEAFLTFSTDCVNLFDLFLQYFCLGFEDSHASVRNSVVFESLQILKNIINHGILNSLFLENSKVTHRLTDYWESLLSRLRDKKSSVGLETSLVIADELLDLFLFPIMTTSFRSILHDCASLKYLNFIDVVFSALFKNVNSNYFYNIVLVFKPILENKQLCQLFKIYLQTKASHRSKLVNILEAKNEVNFCTFLDSIGLQSGSSQVEIIHIIFDDANAMHLQYLTDFLRTGSLKTEVEFPNDILNCSNSSYDDFIRFFVDLYSKTLSKNAMDDGVELLSKLIRRVSSEYLINFLNSYLLQDDFFKYSDDLIILAKLFALLTDESVIQSIFITFSTSESHQILNNFKFLIQQTDANLTNLFPPFFKFISNNSVVITVSDKFLSAIDVFFTNNFSLLNIDLIQAILIFLHKEKQSPVAARLCNRVNQITITADEFPNVMDLVKVSAFYSSLALHFPLIFNDFKDDILRKALLIVQYSDLKFLDFSEDLIFTCFERLPTLYVLFYQNLSIFTNYLLQFKSLDEADEDGRTIWKLFTRIIARKGNLQNSGNVTDLVYVYLRTAASVNILNFQTHFPFDKLPSDRFLILIPGLADDHEFFHFHFFSKLLDIANPPKYMLPSILSMLFFSVGNDMFLQCKSVLNLLVRNLLKMSFSNPNFQQMVYLLLSFIIFNCSNVKFITESEFITVSSQISTMFLKTLLDNLPTSLIAEFCAKIKYILNQLKQCTAFNLNQDDIKTSQLAEIFEICLRIICPDSDSVSPESIGIPKVFKIVNNLGDSDIGTRISPEFLPLIANCCRTFLKRHHKKDNQESRPHLQGPKVTRRNSLSKTPPKKLPKRRSKEREVHYIDSSSEDF
ncbi:hypothetical protein GEMRC1_011864 [Eukaryota sp. GEM-RC1]